ncbi:MAG: MATE family efflux transporter [Elusimicrobiaceae bacterium]|nr:MATE family efflux transporter [Elusimicrobiaceae bacterium]
MSVQKSQQGSVKELWLLSYPLIVTMGAQVVMQFVDRMFLAWYSHEALAACVPGGILALTFGSLFAGLAGYTSVFIAQYHARKKYASVSISLWQGILLALFSWGILVTLTPLGNELIRFFDHGAQVVPLEIKYFTILNLFSGLAILNNALASFFSGRGKTKIPMWVALIGNVSNIVVNYGLIFGKWGLPQWGIVGAAWATVIGGASMSVCFGLLILRARKKYKLGKLAGFYRPIFVRMLRYGVPNGFGFLMDVMSFTLFTFMVGHIDVISLQASNIVMSMQPVVFMVILGLGMGIQILISRYQGINRADLSLRVVKSACKLGYAYAGVVAAAFFCFPEFFIHLFITPGSPDSALITAKALPLVRLVSFFVLGDATYLIFGEALRGAGDTHFYMRVMIFCAWGLLTPGTWMLVYQMHSSIFAVWSWLTLYAWVTALFMLVRFLQGKWKKIRVTIS